MERRRGPLPGRLLRRLRIIFTTALAQYGIDARLEPVQVTLCRADGTPITRYGENPRAVFPDPAPGRDPYPRKELARRLRRRECELCETGATVAVHQVTGLKTLGEPGPGQPAWAALMARMRRKTLVVCAAGHAWIHANPVADAA